jgi:sugar phosphate isomerase/epimerase
VAIVREIADLAAAAGLRVALYPHKDNWIERVQDAARVAKKSQRKNVGAIFNEVHFFLVGDEEKLEPTLRAVAPYLFVVSINGTDSGYQGQDLARLLQPLDRGSFDNLRLLELLREVGYTGPIALHCYKIPGDVRDYLARSLAAWQKLAARRDAEKP